MLDTELEDLRVIFFDLDGVLLNSLDTGIKIFQQLFKKEYGRYMCPDEEKKLRHTWGQPGLKVLNFIYPDKCSDELRRIWYKIEGHREIHLFPNSLITLKSLQDQGLLTGLATNRPLSSIAAKCQEIFQVLNIAQIYSPEHNQDEDLKAMPNVRKAYPELKLFISRNSKPDQTFFDQALKYLRIQYNLTTKDIGLIGDSIVDLQTAVAARLGYFGGVTTGALTKQDWLDLDLAEDKLFNSIEDFSLRLRQALLKEREQK